MSRFVLPYFLCFFFFLSLFSSGFIDSQDGLQYLTIARRIYYDRTLQMPTADWDSNTNIYMNVQKSKDGKVYAPTGLGYSLALLPAVAVEDLFYRLAGIRPIQAFPLQNDWPVLLFASFTNSIFGALFAVALYLFYRAHMVPHRTSAILSAVLVISSSVLIYSKHAFPHMLFTAALLCTFLFIKKFGQTNFRTYLLMAGFCYGVLILSYNQTYILPLVPLATYYVAQRWSRMYPSVANLVSLAKDILVGLLGGALPILAYLQFNAVRFGGTGVSVETTGALPNIGSPPAYVVLEGVWGLLFSPGKSFIFFSPVLLVLLFFWHKLPKRAVSEAVAFVLLLLIYIFAIGTYSDNSGFALWHGDASYGPRYVFPILSLGLVLVGLIIANLSRLFQLLFVAPLIIIGIAVQAIGLLLPYQVRFFQQADYAMINGEKLHVTQYGNMIPRYSPIFSMAKLAYKRIKNYPTRYGHGDFNVRLYDGFERPFDLGYSVWREPHSVAHLSFSVSEEPIRTLALQFRNHQIAPESSISAQLTFVLDGALLSNGTQVIPVNSEQGIQLQIPSKSLLAGKHELVIRKKFLVEPPSLLKQKQVVFLQILRINGASQPITSIDYPYVSPISQSLFDKSYSYFGAVERDPWNIWHMHSGVYESTFDFWWLRPEHYWDLPKGFFRGLLAAHLIGFVYFGWLAIKHRE